MGVTIGSCTASRLPGSTTALPSVLSDICRTWPQLVVTDLLSRLIVIVASVPLVGGLLKLILFRTEDQVLTDDDELRSGSRGGDSSLEVPRS